MIRKFISWRRVSTGKQAKSGLGLEAQKSIIKYFVDYEKGVLIADLCGISARYKENIIKDYYNG